MAPNQTKLASITESLSQVNLSSLAVKTEFLPLTHPKERQLQDESKPTTTIINSDDYWTWTPSEDDTRKTFSTAHIEEQLIQDAQRRSTKVETVFSSTTEEGYWDMPCETDTTDQTVSPQHQSYWDWPSDAKDVFSAESIVDNMVHQRPNTTDCIVSTRTQADYWDMASENVVRATRTHARYWDWESTAKAALILMLKKEEEARVLLSANHIEQNLRQASLDQYWKWEVAQQKTSDVYWDWSAQQPIATGPADYWDW